MQTKFTENAIAYLKRVYRDDNPPDIIVPPEAMPVTKNYTSDFCVCYVVDSDNVFKYVQENHLKEDGISRDELHSIGVANLRKWAISHEVKVQTYGSIFAVLMGGNFEASLILLDGLWDGPFKQFVTGEYAAAMPARDILSFCDNTSPEGIAGLEQLITRASGKIDHPISDKIHVRRGGIFEPRV